ncbi:MAG TPA: hypothetical protein VF179_29940 [Thermoanaerobaculia bacterium]|nr:hypothetical protein [Thermoanaerobaculia bacterium]
MNLFKGIAVFIGWVTSSFAGIAAVLYACGYLISQAQLRSLGLSGILERTPDYYLQEGASFFVSLVSRLSLMIPWLFWAGCIFLFFLILGSPAAIYLCKRREQVTKRLARARRGIARAFERRPWLWRNAAFLLLLCTLIFYLTRYLNDFAPALNVSNLLYGGPGQPESSKKSVELAGWILADERDKLEDHFYLLLWATLQTGVVLALAWHVIRPARLKMWLVAPFVVLFLMYGLFLPLAYGTLLRPTRFPIVVLTSEKPLPDRAKGSLFLLHKTESELVLWDERERRVLWVPSDQILAAEVKEIRSLFAKPKSSP